MKLNNEALSSLSIFFPFFNDAGTVLQQIDDAYYFGGQVTKDLEVIALHGGASHDSTWAMIHQAQKKHPSLRIIDRHNNKEGYAVIRFGFSAATKDWIFYTDGDRQYHVSDLLKLVEAQQQTRADLINGYKIRRQDNLVRQTLGNAYAISSQLLLQTKIRDPHCDFRLMRRSLLNDFRPHLKGARILDELLVYLKTKKPMIAEVPVSHYVREYGTSNYSILRLFTESLTGIVRLLWQKK